MFILLAFSLHLDFTVFFMILIFRFWYKNITIFNAMQHEMQHEIQCEDDTKLQPGISAGPCYLRVHFLPMYLRVFRKSYLLWLLSFVVVFFQTSIPLLYNFMIQHFSTGCNWFRSTNFDRFFLKKSNFRLTLRLYRRIIQLKIRKETGGNKK